MVNAVTQRAPDHVHAHSPRIDGPLASRRRLSAPLMAVALLGVPAHADGRIGQRVLAHAWLETPLAHFGVNRGAASAAANPVRSTVIQNRHLTEKPPCWVHAIH